MATRIRGKSKQTFRLLRIEQETSRSESRALANCMSHNCSFDVKTKRTIQNKKKPTRKTLLHKNIHLGETDPAEPLISFHDICKQFDKEMTTTMAYGKQSIS